MSFSKSAFAFSALLTGLSTQPAFCQYNPLVTISSEGTPIGVSDDFTEKQAEILEANLLSYQVGKLFFKYYENQVALLNKKIKVASDHRDELEELPENLRLELKEGTLEASHLAVSDLENELGKLENNDGVCFEKIQKRPRL